jgi:hypothetical protein
MPYAFRYLSDVYRLKRFHAFLDVALIRTDVEINQDEDCIGAHMQRVGDALKAVGRFGEAARVYCESAETHLQEKNDKTTLYNSAGHAFTRSREFPLRKKAFVQALYFGDESNMWDLESKEYTKCQEGQCLEGLYYLYGQWRLEAHEQDRNTTMSCDAEKISVAFVALCHAAKLSCAEDNPMYMCLKPKFHAKKAAKRSLTAACRYQDVHTFRKEVISCLIVGFRPEMLGPILRNKENERDEDVLRDVRLSRDYLKSKSHGKGTVRRTCANLNCEECENEKDGNIFMNCPCKVRKPKLAGSQCPFVQYKVSTCSLAFMRPYFTARNPVKLMTGSAIRNSVAGMLKKKQAKGVRFRESRFQQQLSGTWNEQVLANGPPDFLERVQCCKN